MNKGIVKFFNNDKGYGFIINIDTKEEIFVHITECIDDIRKNDNVLFNSKQSQKGPVAIDVRLDR